MAQYNSEPNSDLTIQQTVAASIGGSLVPADVVVTGVITSPTDSPAISVAYTVTVPAVDSPSTGAAYTAYSDALTKSITSGLFSDILSAQATRNAAIYLAKISVVPQQAVIQSSISSVPTRAPTAVPSYAPGLPTPAPTTAPTVSPTSLPTTMPLYAAGQPTPIPTTASPSFAPTLSPTYMHVIQVCKNFGEELYHNFSHILSICLFLHIQVFTGITVPQYSTEPNSALTIQEAVAASIGYSVQPSNVAVTGVAVSPSSAADIIVRYIVTAPSTPFATVAEAYTTYADALTTSIARGSFAATLTAQATTNGAIYLASSSMIPLQASVRNMLTATPTAEPSYMPTVPTRIPTALPTYSPGSPTPVPTSTVPPATLYVLQVCR